MIQREVSIYAKSGGVMLNWETDTKTDMDLNMSFAHTAKHMGFI